MLLAEHIEEAALAVQNRTRQAVSRMQVSEESAKAYTGKVPGPGGASLGVGQGGWAGLTCGAGHAEG